MRRTSLLLAILLAIAGGACETVRTPEERELADLRHELKEVESEIAGLERVSSMSGEAPGGEIGGLREKRDRLLYDIERLEARIARQQEE